MRLSVLTGKTILVELRVFLVNPIDDLFLLASTGDLHYADVGLRQEHRRGAHTGQV